MLAELSSEEWLNLRTKSEPLWSGYIEVHSYLLVHLFDKEKETKVSGIRGVLSRITLNIISSLDLQ